METEAAPAKLNLYLHVVGRRDDGYHLLDSLVAFAEAGDVLRARPANGLRLTLDGAFGRALAGEPDNLVLRAARLLAEAAGVPPHAELVLEKNLPVASGIGGGSADAAAALRLLQRLWNVSLPAATLQQLALRLGADVPVCLHGHPVRMGGIGERLEPVPALPPCGLLLVNPGVAVQTRPVFQARTGGFLRRHGFRRGGAMQPTLPPACASCATTWKLPPAACTRSSAACSPRSQNNRSACCPA